MLSTISVTIATFLIVLFIGWFLRRKEFGLTNKQRWIASSLFAVMLALGTLVSTLLERVSTNNQFLIEASIRFIPLFVGVFIGITLENKYVEKIRSK